MARQSAPLGQNFLVDEGVADRIVALLPPPPVHLLEVGPGPGILTRRLLERPDTELTLVERDARWAEHWRSHQGGAHPLRVLEEDIRKVRLDSIWAEPGCLLTNLPYYLSRDFVLWLLKQPLLPRKVVLMVQKEFALKLLGPDHPLGVCCRLAYGVKRALTVPAGAFRPMPKVISTVLVLDLLSGERRSPVQEALFRDWIFRAFAAPRRTLAANWEKLVPRAELAALLVGEGLDERIRAEAVPPERWLPLLEALARTQGRFPT